MRRTYKKMENHFSHVIFEVRIVDLYTKIFFLAHFDDRKAVQPLAVAPFHITAPYNAGIDAGAQIKT